VNIAIDASANGTWLGDGTIAVVVNTVSAPTTAVEPPVPWRFFKKKD
tara:strand:- start:380 stop:520 length:141 start_codon:yes stop_codon:yes gene_type:complete